MENIKFLKNPELDYFEAHPRPSKSELKSYYQNKYHENKIKLNREYTSSELKYKRIGAREAIHLCQSKPGTMLDVGCGEGFFLKEFNKNGWTVTGLDFSSDGINELNPDCIDKLIVGDVYEELERLSKSNQKFEFICINHVIEHVLEPKKVLEQLKGMLTENGLLRVSVPNDFSEIQKFLVNNKNIKENFWACYPDHLNYFNTNSLEKLIRSTGLKVIKKLAEFPIEFFLFHTETDYISKPEVGKICHYSRVEFENFLSMNLENMINFREGCFKAGIGRSLTVYCEK